MIIRQQNKRNMIEINTYTILQKIILSDIDFKISVINMFKK